LNKKKKGIEKETAEVKKELDKEDPKKELRKKTAASRERLKRIEVDLEETNEDIEKLKTIIPDTDKKLKAAKKTLAGLPEENKFRGGTVAGKKARYAECTKNWVQLDPGRKGGGGDLLNLEKGNIRDKNKFRAFLREINANGEKLVLLIRPSGGGRKDTSGVENYYLARQIAEDQGSTPGHLALREGVKIQFGDEK
jgi:chromosome segregation ATPase